MAAHPSPSRPLALTAWSEAEREQALARFRLWQNGNSAKPPLQRDQNLRQIRRQGRQRWKRASGYHRRSLDETAMSRFKTTFGNTLQARTLPRQVTEARIKCCALNRMAQLGMPNSYRVT